MKKSMGFLLLATVVAAGCGNEGNRAQGKAAGVAVERDALRVRTDTARSRLWVLGLDDVRVYDVASKRLIRQIPLPGWSVARFICDPDLVLDGSGSAIVSSNVQSRLWRVDGGTFQVKEQVISLRERERWDIGFGALAFAADGSLFAVTATANSLWKIDLAGAKGSLVETYHPPLQACAVTAQSVNRPERSRKP